MTVRWHRRVFRWTADDSPNVRAGRAEYPGLLTKEEKEQRELLWDEQRQAVGLRARFWEGPDLKLYPRERLDRAKALAAGRGPAQGRKWLGVDPAEGGDLTAWAVVDRLGLLRLVTLRTADTNLTYFTTLELMKQLGVAAVDVCFDRSFGLAHADRLRAAGYPVRTVAFGESIKPELKRSMTQFAERVEARDEATVYRNRRTEMYWALAALLDPVANPAGFALPAELLDARGARGQRRSLGEQMLAVPKETDSLGRPHLRPKNRNPGQDENRHKTLVELVGHSPDELDALVLAVHAMRNEPTRTTAGVR